MNTTHLDPAPHATNDESSLGGAQPAVVAYEPPRLLLVGRVQDLVAGGAGTTFETQDPFLSKMAGQPG